MLRGLGTSACYYVRVVDCTDPCKCPAWLATLLTQTLEVLRPAQSGHGFAALGIQDALLLKVQVANGHFQCWQRPYH